jgi:hypothetical protein
MYKEVKDLILQNQMNSQNINSRPFFPKQMQPEMQQSASTPGMPH